MNKAICRTPAGLSASTITGFRQLTQWLFFGKYLTHPAQALGPVLEQVVRLEAFEFPKALDDPFLDAFSGRFGLR